MFKDKVHFVEELTKSIQKDIAAKAEELQKGKDWPGQEHLGGKARFQDTSHLKISESAEKHGYTVHETKKNGEVTVHPHVPVAELDNMTGRQSKLRLTNKGAKNHDCHTEAVVQHHGVVNLGNGKTSVSSSSATVKGKKLE